MSPVITIGSLNPVLGAIFAVSLFALWRYHREHRYIALLALCYATRTAGYVTQYFFLQHGILEARLLSNLMFAVTAICLALAIARRFGQAPRYLWLGAVFSATMTGYCWFHFIDDSFTGRVLAMNIGLAVVTLLVVFDIAKVPGLNLIEKVLLGQLILAFAGFVLRPSILLVVDPASLQAAPTYWFVVAASDIILSTLLALSIFAIIAVDIVGRLKAESTSDPLSGLLNRRGFEFLARQAMERQRATGWPSTALVCDLDHFKSINDRFGHAVGDKVIGSFGEILVAQAPPDAIIARTGGEEFAVLFPQGPVPFVRLFAEAVRNALRSQRPPLLPAGDNPTASFGIATTQGEEELRSLLDRADQALYRAKRDGRDRVRLAEEDDAPEIEMPLLISAHRSPPRIPAADIYRLQAPTARR